MGAYRRFVSTRCPMSEEPTIVETVESWRQMVRGGRAREQARRIERPEMVDDDKNKLSAECDKLSAECCLID